MGYGPNDYHDAVHFLDSMVREYSAGYFPVGLRVRYMVELIEKLYPSSPDRDAHLAAARSVLAARAEAEWTINCLKLIVEKYCDGIEGAEELVRSFIDHTEQVQRGRHRVLVQEGSGFFLVDAEPPEALAPARKNPDEIWLAEYSERVIEWARKLLAEKEK